MHALILSALLMGAPPEQSAGGTQNSYDDNRSRATTSESDKSPIALAQELRDKVSHLLRREATTEGAENRDAVIDLLQLYNELTYDKYLTRDERIRLRAKVRSRLLKIRRRIERELSYAKKRAARRGDDADEEVEDAKAFAEAFDRHLFQLGRGIGGGARAADEVGDELIELIKKTVRPSSWDDQGGPGTIMLFPRLGAIENGLQDAGELVSAKLSTSLRGGRGGGVEDYGEELVELIQTVIAPESWDVNGGPGTIFYYRHLHVLVVRQTGQVHDNLGGALKNLRAAGR